MKRTMLAITLVTFIPSVFIGLHMVRVSIFEVQADKYIAQVFNFPQTRVIESSKIYRRAENRLVSNCCWSGSRSAKM